MNKILLSVLLVLGGMQSAVAIPTMSQSVFPRAFVTKQDFIIASSMTALNELSIYIKLERYDVANQMIVDGEASIITKGETFTVIGYWDGVIKVLQYFNNSYGTYQVIGYTYLKALDPATATPLRLETQ
jgi:hypothetical protein